jgi:hypothetical protein
MPEEVPDENHAITEAEFDYQKVEVEKAENQTGEPAWTLTESHWKILEERLNRIEERLAKPEQKPEPEPEPEPELEPPQLIVEEKPLAENAKPKKKPRRRSLRWPKLKRR